MTWTEWFLKNYGKIVGAFWALLALGLCLPCLVIFAGALLQK